MVGNVEAVWCEMWLGLALSWAATGSTLVQCCTGEGAVHFRGSPWRGHSDGVFAASEACLSRSQHLLCFGGLTQSYDVLVVVGRLNHTR
jgi:hypothetical protein